MTCLKSFWNGIRVKFPLPWLQRLRKHARQENWKNLHLIFNFHIFVGMQLFTSPSQSRINIFWAMCLINRCFPSLEVHAIYPEQLFCGKTFPNCFPTVMQILSCSYWFHFSQIIFNSLFYFLSVFLYCNELLWWNNCIYLTNFLLEFMGENSLQVDCVSSLLGITHMLPLLGHRVIQHTVVPLVKKELVLKGTTFLIIYSSIFLYNNHEEYQHFCA